jgi:hypothetical protein
VIWAFFEHSAINGSRALIQRQDYLRTFSRLTTRQSCRPFAKEENNYRREDVTSTESQGSSIYYS